MKYGWAVTGLVVGAVTYVVLPADWDETHKLIVSGIVAVGVAGAIHWWAFST